MGDPGQTDLIEFLAGEAATAAPRSPVLHGSAGMRFVFIMNTNLISARWSRRTSVFNMNT